MSPARSNPRPARRSEPARASRCAAPACTARACSRSRSFAKGERIVEYTGQIITWKEALRRHPHDPADPNHTFYFHIDDGRVIDGKFGGNAAKWINHSCQPNCETDEDDGRVWVKAKRRDQARRGAELRLRLDPRRPPHREGQERVRVPLRQPQMPRHPARAEALTPPWPGPRCTGTPRRFGAARSAPARARARDRRRDRVDQHRSARSPRVSDLSQPCLRSPSSRPAVADGWAAAGAPSAARR